MSKETRILRPFNIHRKLENALQDVCLVVSDISCTAGGRVIRNWGTSEVPKAYIAWAHSPENLREFKHKIRDGAAKTGISENFMTLLVVGHVGYLKASEIIFELPLKDLDNLTVQTSLNGLLNSTQVPQALYAQNHRAEITVLIALRSDIQSRDPLKPSRKSTWLAREKYRIESETDSRLYSLQPLTDEARVRLRLKSNTVYYIELETVTEPLRDGNLPTFWINEEILDSLVRNSSTPISALLQATLAMQLIGDAVSKFQKDSDDEPTDYDSLADSLIGKIAKLVAGRDASASKCDQILAVAINSPRLFTAWAQDSLELKSYTLKSLEQRN